MRTLLPTVNYGVFPPEGEILFLAETNSPGGKVAHLEGFFVFLFSDAAPVGVHPGGL